MKVLDVDSLMTGLEEGVRDIDHLHGKISAAQRSIRDFYAMKDALSGKGGEAIRYFFHEVHQPFLIFLYQSLQDYKNVLTKMQGSVEGFEPNPSGLIRQDFLENEVTDGFEKVKDRTVELTDDANSIISSVQDLVTVDRIDDTEVLETVDRGKKNVRNIVEDLHTLDRTQVQAMESVRADLQTMRSYLADVESKVKRGELSVTDFNIEALVNINGYSTMMESIYGEEYLNNAQMERLIEKMTNGETLSQDEQEMLYVYFRDEYLNAGREDELKEIIDFISEDRIEELKKRLNNKVITSKDKLEKEMVMVHAYLYMGEQRPGELDVERDDRAKLEAYLILLNNYHSALDGGIIAEVNMLNYEENPNDISGHYFETALQTAEFDPASREVMSDEEIREYRFDPENPMVKTFDLTELTYYSSASSNALYQHLLNEGLAEKEANYTSNFIAKEVINRIISEVGKGADAIQTWIEFQSGKQELEEAQKIGDTQKAAAFLGMEFSISQNGTVPGRNEIEVQLHPTQTTYHIIDRWEAVKGVDQNIPYREDLIVSQDWYEISDFLSDNNTKIDNDILDFITNGTPSDHPIVQEVIRNNDFYENE